MQLSLPLRSTLTCILRSILHAELRRPSFCAPTRGHARAGSCTTCIEHVLTLVEPHKPSRSFRSSVRTYTVTTYVTISLCDFSITIVIRHTEIYWCYTYSQVYRSIMINTMSVTISFPDLQRIVPHVNGHSGLQLCLCALRAIVPLCHCA
jgi:hypothetical protein